VKIVLEDSFIAVAGFRDEVNHTVKELKQALTENGQIMLRLQLDVNSVRLLKKHYRADILKEICSLDRLFYIKIASII